MVFVSFSPVGHDVRTSGEANRRSTDVSEDIFVSGGLESPEPANASAPSPILEAIHQHTP